MNRLVTVFLVFVFFISSGFNQPDAKTFYENALASLNKKDYIQAISEFTNAISLKPDYADAYYHRATAKELLGKKMGFFSSEMCSDLVSAMINGKVEAIDKLEKSCMGECFDLDAAFVEPEIVYCADFSSKLLIDLPAGSEKLAFLVKLNFFNNKLTTLSDKFGKLDRLISLDLSSNKITSIPAVVGKMTRLRELNVSKNQIATLPYEFGNLKQLKLLNMRQNALTTVPKSVATLSSLETLDLAFNKLTSMPIEIANLKNLKTLILVGNEIPVSEQKKIKALLPNTTVNFE
ncbi:MAG TPA: leucine-rich repeat domain-containing protein [Cytophagaceae bacterium]|nr:leucine-rich repeat domain-containing protein [Cytophagaceae bacterium]